MTPERYAQVCELFDQAERIAPAEREAFLRAACGDDGELATEVRRMLAAATCSLDPFAAADLTELPAAGDGVALVGCRVGPYVLRRLVGSGGMGSVYLAERVGEFRQQVALKLVKGGPGAGSLVDRFRIERQVLADLCHPNIARLLDGGTTPDGQPYFVMEYIAGRPLGRWCEEQRLPTRERARLLRDACAAVEYAHARGVIHRDLKPGNILVTDEGVVKIVDFGLAKQLDANEDSSDRTQTGVILGTPSYMAPEQAAGRGHAVSPAADVYALGAILYELLTGRPPFRGDTSVETVMQVLHDDPVPPSRLHPGLPTDLETVALKCLQKEPARRYSSAAALADDLDHFLAGEPIAARPVSQLERLGRWARRKPGVAALSALVVVLLLGGLVGATLAALGFRSAAEQERDLSGKLQRSNDELEESLYTQSIAVAERELSARQDVERAERLLEACPERLRGWEWHHLQRLLDGPPLALHGHTDGVWSVAFDPKRRRLASGSIDGTVRVWDVETGHTVRTLPGSRLYPVMCLAYSPNGDRIAAAGLAPKLDLKLSLDPLELVRPAGIVKVWDVETGKLALTYNSHDQLVVGVGFDPRGRHIASAGFGNVVRVWDGRTGKDAHLLKGHTDWVNRVCYSPNGATLASPSMDGTVRLWDVASGSEIGCLRGHAGPVRDAEFSRDGRLLATAGMDGRVIVWDVQTRAALHTLRGHDSSVMAVGFHPAGDRLASGGFDKTVKVWNLRTGSEAITLRGHTDSVCSVAFSADGHLLASGSLDKVVRLWDATPRTLRPGPPALTPQGHSDRVNDVAFDPTGKLLATTSWDRTVRLWDAATGRELRRLDGHVGPVFRLVFRKDGRRLATASWDRTARLWDVATGRLLHTFTGHATGVHGVSFSPDGATLATGCLDGTVKLWDAETGAQRRTLRGHLNLAYAVAFSPDGKLLASGAGDRTVVLWDAATGKRLRTLRGHGAVIHGLAFSPDGTTLASASWDHTAKLWDTSTGAERRTLRGHADRVHSVAFTPDGRHLATVAEDRTARFWDVQTGVEVAPPRNHRGVIWGVAWHPDGRRLASASWYTRAGIALWEGPHFPAAP